jgi:gas vesicle protein
MANSGKGFALGLLTGAAIGSIVALLYAPDSGSKLRGKVTYKVSAYGDEINKLIRKLKAEKEKIASDAKQQGDNVVSDAKKRADDLIKEAEALLDNIEKTKPNNN